MMNFALDPACRLPSPPMYSTDGLLFCGGKEGGEEEEEEISLLTRAEWREKKEKSCEDRSNAIKFETR